MKGKSVAKKKPVMDYEQEEGREVAKGLRQALLGGKVMVEGTYNLCFSPGPATKLCAYVDWLEKHQVN